MKWLDRWILKRAEKLMVEDIPTRTTEKYPFAGNSIGTVANIGGKFEVNGMNFKVYKASGGTIIETNQYDRRTDRHTNGLYIITDDKDLGKEIGKIITMESLRN